MKESALLVVRILGVGLLLRVAVPVVAVAEYEDPPPRLVQVVTRTADRAVSAFRSSSGEAQHANVKTAVASESGETLLFAAEAGMSLGMLRMRDETANLAETARTDKHVGTSSGASGSASLIEKPGIPRLLSFAIENGAIQQEVRGTNLTLSSSPYLLVALMNGGDTQPNYLKYDDWARVGFSASFSAEDGQAATINNLDMENVSQLSVRISLLDDPSTRSNDFLKLWKKRIQGKIQRQLDALVQAETRLVQDVPALAVKRKMLYVGKDAVLPRRVLSYLTANQGAAEETQRAEVKRIILSVLKVEVVDPISSGGLPVDPEVRQEIMDKYLVDLYEAEIDLRKVPAQVDELIEEFKAQTHLLTVAGTLNRIDQGTDFTEAKLLYQHHLAVFAFDLNANGGIAFNHEPDRGMNQHVVRSFSFSIGADATFDNPLAAAFSRKNQDPIQVSLSGKIERAEDLDDEIAVGELKFEIPLMPGTSLPLSFTYASRTETSDGGEFRVNFGAGIDMDKIMAVARSLVPG